MDSNSVGVIIGRFQTPFLHDGHRKLIRTAMENHSLIIVMIGVTQTPPNKDNPLDYPTRECMFKEFPNVVTVPLIDMPNHAEWVKNVDSIIDTICLGKKAVLYFGRNSAAFLYSISGKNEIKQLDFNLSVSSTLIRKNVASNRLNDEYFRKGIVYGIHNLLPRTYMTVDIAMVKPLLDKKDKIERFEILMGRKKGREKLRFPGGFVDLNDSSLEEAAKRELFEETNFVAEHPLHYVGSFEIDDWRTKGQSDVRIMTAFFYTEYCFGIEKAGDDLESLAWVESDINPNLIEPNHHSLMEALKNELNLING